MSLIQNVGEDKLLVSGVVFEFCLGCKNCLTSLQRVSDHLSILM